MPKRTSAPPEIVLACHGRSPTSLADYLAGKRDFPKPSILKFIGTASPLVESNSNITRNDAAAIVAAFDAKTPLILRKPDLYLFGKQVWAISKLEQTYSEEELRLSFLEALDNERNKWERLKSKFSGVAGESVGYIRKPIPQHVRIHVWRRDCGQCVQCGSKEKLEYDHQVPVSKGGSNTERNIQLLCETCNRQKSDNI